ncbi:MAG: hypothetical protein ACPGUE_07970 [Marinomonas sp.]
MPQINDANTAHYDSGTSQGISIEELLANARNNKVAPPSYSTPNTAPNTVQPNIPQTSQAISSKEKFELALEREKMRTLLQQAEQTNLDPEPIEPYIPEKTQPKTAQENTISISSNPQKNTLWSPYANRNKGINLYHKQRKAKEEELKSFLITLSFQTNSAAIDAILEEELDLFSRLHKKEQLVINCAISKEEDAQLAYETALIRCLSIETFFKQRNHNTMSQVLKDIEPNQVLIFSDGQGF